MEEDNEMNYRHLNLLELVIMGISWCIAYPVIKILTILK